MYTPRIYTNKEDNFCILYFNFQASSARKRVIRVKSTIQDKYFFLIYFFTIFEFYMKSLI